MSGGGSGWLTALSMITMKVLPLWPLVLRHQLQWHIPWVCVLVEISVRACVRDWGCYER